MAQLEEQVRFFKAAYGVEEGTPMDIIHAANVVVGLTAGQRLSPGEQEEVRRMVRHVIAQGNRAETAEKLAKRLHETVIKVSETVAHALDNAAADSAPRPPLWLLALGNELDMVLAEAALENR